MEAKERIEELRKIIEYHSKKYYDEDKPEISDYEYDTLMNELKKIRKRKSRVYNKRLSNSKGWRSC